MHPLELLELSSSTADNTTVLSTPSAGEEVKKQRLSYQLDGREPRHNHSGSRAAIVHLEGLPTLSASTALPRVQPTEMCAHVHKETWTNSMSETRYNISPKWKPPKCHWKKMDKQWTVN